MEDTTSNKEFLKKQKKLEYQRKYRASMSDDIKQKFNDKVAENNRNRYNSDPVYKQTKNQLDTQRVKDNRQKAKLYEESLKIIQPVITEPVITDIPYHCKYCKKTYTKYSFKLHLTTKKHDVNVKL